MAPKSILPILGPSAPEPPPYGGLGLEGWSRGLTFLDFVESAGEHRAEIESAFAGMQISPDAADFFATYPRRVRVLALGSVDDSVARIYLAQAERLFTLGKSIWMRIFAPETCPDLVQRYGPTAHPILVFFGDDRREFARWAPAMRAPGAAIDDPSGRARARDLAQELRLLLSARSDGTA